MIIKEKTMRYINIAIVSIGFYFLFIFLFSRTIVDYDIWGYLSFGKIFWENGYFPYKDIFSYTPTKNIWIYHEWLTGVILYPILKYTGPAGIQLFRYIFIVITIYVIYRTAINKSATPLVSFVCISCAIIVMSWGYTPVMRAQIFTYLFFALTIYIVEIARKDERWLILLLLLPIMILWCNLHGGFVAGLGIIAVYAIGDALSGRKFIPLVLICIAGGVVTIINPYGINYWTYIIDAVFMPRPNIYEWLSVISSIKNNYLYFLALIFIILSVIVIICLFLLGKYKHNLTEIMIILVLIYLGYKHIRHTVLFAIVFASFMPYFVLQLSYRYLNNYIYDGKFNKASYIFLSIFFISINYFAYVIKPQEVKLLPLFSISASSSMLPTGALRWLEENDFEGNILPEFEWGQYLIWSTYPKCKVAMDGRYETVYPDHVQKEYFDFQNGREGWKTFLNKYSHDAVLVRARTIVHSLMLQEKSWKLVYEDNLSVLFLKKDYKYKIGSEK